MNKVIQEELALIRHFLALQGGFLAGIGSWLLGWANTIKTISTKLMFRQQGRFSQTFVNVSMGTLAFLTIVFSGKLEEMVVSNRNNANGGSNYLILAADVGGGVNTLVADSNKGEIYEYRVEEGDTVASIAQKFKVSMDTIVWENNLKSIEAIKPKQILKILPVTGVRHTVKRGETIYSIAKTYQVDAQNIIDYPFNTFSDDENFTLAAGQDLIIPDGVEPKGSITGDNNQYMAKQVAPPAAGVHASGSFTWPTSGHISQKFYWYHQAVDIANPSNPPILAAAKGTVVVAGWNGGGYGNYVIIDHGNGFKTLYGHMLNNDKFKILVHAGQVVEQGQQIGTMGSTGRSTGTHLHFEIKTDNGNIDPLSQLK